MAANTVARRGSSVPHSELSISSAAVSHKPDWTADTSPDIVSSPRTPMLNAMWMSTRWRTASSLVTVSQDCSSSRATERTSTSKTDVLEPSDSNPLHVVMRGHDEVPSRVSIGTQPGCLQSVSFGPAASCIRPHPYVRRDQRINDVIAAFEQTRPSAKDFLQVERLVAPSAIKHVAVAKCLPRSEEPVRHGFGACPYSERKTATVWGARRCFGAYSYPTSDAKSVNLPRRAWP